MCGTSAPSLINLSLPLISRILIHPAVWVKLNVYLRVIELWWHRTADKVTDGSFIQPLRLTHSLIAREQKYKSRRGIEFAPILEINMATTDVKIQ